jgi:hypothetical protein
VHCGLLREAVLAGQRGAGEAPSAPASTVEEAPRGEVESWVIDTVARLTRTRPEPIRAADRLADLGVDSLTHAERIALSKPVPVALWTPPPRRLWRGCGMCSRRCSRTPALTTAVVIAAVRPGVITM